MKIRIKGNSVRFRLTRSEVEKFSREGYIEDVTEFPGTTFKYALKASPSVNTLDVDMLDNTITILFPDAEKLDWYKSDKVTYKELKKLDNGKAIGILVEKDFACLDHIDEDQSDNYPNPNKTC